MDLAEAMYLVATGFPRDEQFGLRLQVRRAAVSVPSNIAEGQGRSSTGELLHFLSVARGSLCEIQTQVLLAARLSYVDDDACQAVVAQADEVGRLLRGLARSVGVKTQAGQPRRHADSSYEA
jgi:four helix bundle protein